MSAQQPTPEDVARRMADLFNRIGYLHQPEAVQAIIDHFGGPKSEFLSESDRGGSKIDPRVLRIFRRLTPEAGWEQHELAWVRKPAGHGGRLIS